ncbi:unnamed protein product [Adineta steineri]|uniref:Pentapeptide repeat-containing protein n=1 Tax=Adineta steineri TaxID=433720 RepID=A0A815Z095_9BILA|nr:unnamed protein product [Adineta steineri]
MQKNGNGQVNLCCCCKQYRQTKSSPEKTKFWKLTLGELLTALCAAAVPIAVAIYTNNLSEQQRIANERREFDSKQADNLRQQQVYDQFLSDIYQLDKDGQLSGAAKPWALANARYWTANQQLSSQLKSDALIFLKRKGLIGLDCPTLSDDRQDRSDIIQLSGLNFDNIRLVSPTGDLSLLDMACVQFGQVSLVNASFYMTNLDGASFNGSRLIGAKFNSSSLEGVSFLNGADLNGVSFHNSNLRGAEFPNTTLAGVDFGNTDLTGAHFFKQ